MPRRPPGRPEDALARAVLDRCGPLGRGRPVTIETWSHALPWARALVVEARRRGALPVLLVEDERAFFRSLGALGRRSGRVLRSPPADGGGARIYLDGPEEFPRLLGLSPPDLDGTLARHDRAWWASARRARTRALRVAIGDATPTAADRFRVDRASWEAELLRASLLEPRRLEARARPLVRRLVRTRRVRVHHPNGTDFVAELARRRPLVDVGRPDPVRGTVWGRVPAGLVIAPLRPGRAEGTWETNRPAYDRFATPPVALGGRFELGAGRLREFSFDRGGGPFAAAYARQGRGSVRAIALTFGLNPAISFAPESQELGAGTVGLLLGTAGVRPDAARPRFAFLAALAEASVDADGRRWIGPERPRRSPRA